MTEQIMSVGIDLGTTTTQMILSRLVLKNSASDFSVPQMEICGREILYRNQIHFTPLLSDDTLDADRIREIVADAYQKAGISPEEIQTGAVIITGETARKDNARAVLEALADFAGRFVVATAGPALEGVFAAKGAGADRYAREHNTHVLHVDIGGGTSNLALFDPNGDLVDTGCLNIGGRLMKFAEDGTVIYRSPVLSSLTDLAVGDRTNPPQLESLIKLMVQVLEEGMGLRTRKRLYDFVTDHPLTLPETPMVLSFSGGVAELIQNPVGDWLRFGDLGVLLADAIRQSKLCQGTYVLGKETLQATVVGAGSYSTVLSGSTVEYSNMEFPLQDLPVIMVSEREEQAEPEDFAKAISRKLRVVSGGPVVLALRGIKSPSYEQLTRLADGILLGLKGAEPPFVIVVQEDMAKALGQLLRSRMGDERPLICLDGLSLREGSYLDIAAPVGDGTALPVVIKTLAFYK